MSSSGFNVKVTYYFSEKFYSHVQRVFFISCHFSNNSYEIEIFQSFECLAVIDARIVGSREWKVTESIIYINLQVVG